MPRGRYKLRLITIPIRMLSEFGHRTSTKYCKNSVYRDGRQESRLSGISVLGGEYAQPLAISSIFALKLALLSKVSGAKRDHPDKLSFYGMRLALGKWVLKRFPLLASMEFGKWVISG